MAVTTVGDKEGDQIAHTLDIGAIDDRTPSLARSHEARARQDGEVGRERVVRRANNVRNGAGGKALGLPSKSRSRKISSASAGRAPLRPPAHPGATFCPRARPAPRGQQQPMNSSPSDCLSRPSRFAAISSWRRGQVPLLLYMSISLDI